MRLNDPYVCLKKKKTTNLSKQITRWLLAPEKTNLLSRGKSVEYYMTLDVSSIYLVSFIEFIGVVLVNQII